MIRCSYDVRMSEGRTTLVDKTYLCPDGDHGFRQYTIPDSLPPLRRGVGESPRSGGCLMQVTNYLATGLWTDGPARNVAPPLSGIAIQVNDGVCDDHRQQLWPFVPRLMKTYDDDRFGSYRADGTETLRRLLTSIRTDVTNISAFQHVENYRCSSACQALIRDLERAIDVCDEFIGRRRETITDVDWRSMLPDALASLTDEDLRDLRHRSSAFGGGPAPLGCELLMPQAHVSASMPALQQEIVEFQEQINSMGVTIKTWGDQFKDFCAVQGTSTNFYVQDEPWWSPGDKGSTINFEEIAAASPHLLQLT